ncbi:MAG TPA: SMI1/KNR4 family protein [Labilithrix sp.]|nr:SMI1/KNR4 family protein [Labilithrix sp.]
MSVQKESAAFARIVRWLEAHAPRTRAALLPRPASVELDALASELQCELPEGIALLYASCGGQGPESPAGLLRGYRMMPLHGVDGLEAAWPEMLDAHDAGAGWATKDRYPFAKDFAGSYLCVDMGSEGGAAGRIIGIEDGETTELAKDMETFLEQIAGELEGGEVAIDDTIEELESFEVVFDAARPRAPGDAVTHSVFTQLGIDAKVEAIEAHASPFDTNVPRHGFYVRMIARDADVKVASVRLEDDRRRRFGTPGHGSGGGKPGFYVFATSAKGPIPPGSRLHVTLQRSRRV